MKLIPLSIIMLCLAVDAAQEYFTFPPQFQTSRPGVFQTDDSVYLPPEAHTAMPYFPLKNNDKLQYSYLPPTETKSPVVYPRPFPIMVTSTLLPSLNNEDDDDNYGKGINPPQSFLKKSLNYTENLPFKLKAQMRDLKPLSRSFNYQHPIDRIDMKVPYQFPANNEQIPPNTVTQTTPTRSVTISAETRNDHGIDQTKSGNFPIPQYLPLPGFFISSTTETAIPILRLSNEMDLDGSFSYEALGADQTHYVQNSRMENVGTDKQEQVVEGSYSYVGDNGQTYTVHYIADSNGFRATGDHLPVAPPIPEIIQRAVQYNLAEEAKKPPHLQSWNEENRHEVGESDNNNRFNILPQQNLFTGRTPESFSFNFAQGLSPQNNLAIAATAQTPIKLHNEFSQDQIHAKPSATISPQITFLASQGAHLPSVNVPQQTIARMFVTEKSTMPQLVNYEAMKESDQENNKALWRWQYGLSPETNKTPEKNTISRSFGEDDDVMINFNDMTPEQYTDMIKTHMEPIRKEQSNTSFKKYPMRETNDNVQQQNLQQNKEINSLKQENKYYPTESTTSINPYKTWHHSTPAPTVNEYSTAMNDNMPSFLKKGNSQNALSKLITYRKFVPPSQTVTQSYNYQNDRYKSTATQNLNSVSLPDDDHLNVIPLDYNNKMQNNDWPNMNDIEKPNKSSSTQKPLELTNNASSYQSMDFLEPARNNDFKPLFDPQADKENHSEPSTTTKNFENEMSDNIFLKSFLNKNKIQPSSMNSTANNINNKYLPKSIKKPLLEISPKIIQEYSKPNNEIKDYTMKPIDISEIMNFINAKNQFESSKIKPNNKPTFSNFNQRTETHFTPSEQDINRDDYQETLDSNKDIQNRQYQNELRGIIKNYKVIQRSGSTLNKDKDTENIKRNIGPPYIRQLQVSNLPLLGRAGPSMKSYLPPVYA